MCAAGAGEYQFATVGREIQRLVVAAKPRELFRLATGGWHDVDVVVAHAIACKRNRLPVGRKARHEIARHMGREPPGIVPLLIGHPDVILPGERNRAIVRDVRIARKLERRIGRCLRATK